MITLHSYTHSIPLILFQYVFFLIGNLDKPSATIRFIYTTGIITLWSNLNLPSFNFNIISNNRTDENARISICNLFELQSKIKIIVIFGSSQIAIFLIRATFANQ